MAVPVISYPGSKWRFFKHIKEYIPKDMKVWIEPFLGGASMSLSVADDNSFSKLERMITGDFAPEIYALWMGVRDHADDVMEIADKWFRQACPMQMEFNKATYGLGEEEAKQYYEEAIAQGKAFWDWTQSVDCSALSIPERAARTFLVNRISFSGMGDSGTMSKDQFMGFKLDKLERIKMAEPLLKRMEIYNVSFEVVMAEAHKDPANTFIFLDPPYIQQTSSGLYGRDGDTHKGFDHEFFTATTKSMPCKWFVTYDDSVSVRKLFRGNTDDGSKIYVKAFTIPGGYTMAGKTSEDALAGEEVFIANYDIMDDGSLDDVSSMI